MPLFPSKYKKKSTAQKLKSATIGGYSPAKRMAQYAKIYNKSMSINGKIKRFIRQAAETKYVAENIVAVPTGVPSGQAVPLNCARMLPFLTQGVDDFQRVGNKIKPVGARTTFNLNITNPLAQLLDLTVNIVIFTVKGATTNTAVASVPGGDFLRVGNGTNIDPLGPAGGISDVNMLNFVNNYVVNQERYTLAKWHRVLFKKGPNDANGIPGLVNGPPTVLGAKLHRKIVYKWRPPQLKYDNNAATLPTNHYPVYMIWATTNDATALPANCIGFTVRSELLFKDQ